MSIKDKYQVISIPKNQTYEWLKYKHYAKRVPMIKYSFGLYNGNSLVGVCTFGMPPAPYFSRIFNLTNYCELNRLCVDEGLPKNSLSYFVSRCLKLLPIPMIVISYSDPNQNHSGYIYQATNWIYTGKGRVDINDKRGNNKYFYNDKEFHSRHIPEIMRRLSFDISVQKTHNENWIANGGIIQNQKRKHRYFYLLGYKKDININRQIINDNFIIYPYPKGDNKRYDAEYKTLTQTTLF